jgi:DNA-binding LacI/PurR family transcriptional regulator
MPSEQRGARRPRPRQADIARATGVSQPTVSLILSGHADALQIAEGTRERVLAAARRLGYVVNPVARRLAGGRNLLLGLYTFEPVFPTDHRDFYYPFLQGVEEEAAEQGYDVLLFTSAGGGADRSIFRDGINRLLLADGCVLIGRWASIDELSKLTGTDFPFVFIGRRDVPGLSYVAADYGAATAELVRRLFEHGHQRIAYLRDPEFHPSTEDRQQGFDAGARAIGLAPADTPTFQATPDGLGAAQVRGWIGAGFSGFVTESMLVDAFEEATTVLGLAAPRDFSFATLGDPHPPFFRPDVNEARRTRFSIPRREMGRTAVRTLVDEVMNWQEHREPTRIVLDCTVIDGETIGPPPLPGV